MRAYNQVLADCEGDAVLLSGDCIVSENWLSELGRSPTRKREPHVLRR